MPRTYDMNKRNLQAKQTLKDILDSTESLLAEKALSDISLKEIASKAGTTVQTVLRHTGSRDGCLQAVAKRVAERVELQRGDIEPGNIEKAIRDLVDHYDKEGELVLNLLTQERSGDQKVGEFIQQGRDYHRRWVEQSFLPENQACDRTVVDALVVVTDIYAWKLLRLDLKRSKTETREVMILTIRKILEAS